MTPAEIKRLIEITSHPAWKWPEGPVSVVTIEFPAPVEWKGDIYHKGLVMDEAGRRRCLLPADRIIPNIDDIGTRAACWAVNSGRDDGSPFFTPGRASIIVSLTAAMRDAHHV